MDYRIKVKKGNVEIEVQGTQEFVEEKYGELSELLEQSTSESVESERPVTPEESPELPDNISSFLRQKGNPSTNMARNMVFAYWLDNHGAHEFSAEDISECYRETRRTEPANMSYELTTLAGRGLLLNPRRGVFSISADGIVHVDEMGE